MIFPAENIKNLILIISCFLLRNSNRRSFNVIIDHRKTEQLWVNNSDRWIGSEIRNLKLTPDNSPWAAFESIFIWIFDSLQCSLKFKDIQH